MPILSAAHMLFGNVPEIVTRFDRVVSACGQIVAFAQIKLGAWMNEVWIGPNYILIEFVDVLPLSAVAQSLVGYVPEIIAGFNCVSASLGGGRLGDLLTGSVLLDERLLIGSLWLQFWFADEPFPFAGWSAALAVPAAAAFAPAECFVQRLACHPAAV